MKENNQSNQKLIVFGLILGLALILSSALACYTFYSVRSMNSITTTGSAKKEVTSDKVKWVFTITRPTKVSNVKDSYSKMDTDLKEVKAFLATNGIPDAQIDIAPIFMNEVYDNNNNQTEKNYNLVQNIEIQSDDVQKIAD